MILWIASYPKSGNTWLRTLLSSYYYSEDGIFNQKLLSNIGQFPEKKYFIDFEYNQNIVTDTSKYWIKAQDKINNDRKIKFFKTHNILGSINNINFTNKKNTIGIVYIVRDPRNVLTSIQNHFELTLDGALEFMTNEKKYIYNFHLQNDYSDFQFISSWEKNYLSWTNQKVFPVKIIKYEELQKSTYQIFKEIIEFIEKLKGFEKNFDDEKAKNSVASTSFEKLQNIEKQEGFVESVISKKNVKKIPFFHLGPKNNWRNILDKKYQEKINLVFNKSLQDLNYI
tara:strand:- start:108 stop:956 length:849 start_codon:yes stop_codon:yes gene_type:complete